jgi:hypothetical protein
MRVTGGKQIATSHLIERRPPLDFRQTHLVARDPVAYTLGLADAGWSGDPRLVELGMRAAAVKYDWLTPAMLGSASARRQLRYGGAEEIDADYRFSERGLALLHNARNAYRALELARDLRV